MGISNVVGGATLKIGVQRNNDSKGIIETHRDRKSVKKREYRLVYKKKCKKQRAGAQMGSPGRKRLIGAHLKQK